jgi:hypothetical protein
MGAACCATTAEEFNHRSGFAEDAFVVVFVGGDDVVGAEFFLGVEAGDFARRAGGRAWKERRGPRSTLLRAGSPLRNPTISREVRWEEKVGLLRSG